MAIDMLTEKDIHARARSMKMAKKITERCLERVGEVIAIIHKVRKHRYKGEWYSENHVEKVVLSGKNDDLLEYRLPSQRTKHYREFHGSFPRKFLFMLDDEVLEIVREQVSKEKKNALQAQNKYDHAVAERKNARVAALSKLSNDERKALRLPLKSGKEVFECLKRWEDEVYRFDVIKRSDQYRRVEGNVVHRWIEYEYPAPSPYSPGGYFRMEELGGDGDIYQTHGVAECMLSVIGVEKQINDDGSYIRIYFCRVADDQWQLCGSEENLDLFAAF